MGFFDEFKEDLSQAVGELNAAGTNEEGAPADTLIPETAEEGVQESLNLSEMIDKIPEPVFDFGAEPEVKPEPEPALEETIPLTAMEGLMPEPALEEEAIPDPGLTPDLSFSGGASAEPEPEPEPEAIAEEPVAEPEPEPEPEAIAEEPVAEPEPEP